MKNIGRSLRGALLAGPALLLVACTDSVTDPRQQTFLGCQVNQIFLGETVGGTLSSSDCTVRNPFNDGVTTYTDMWFFDLRDDNDLVIIDLESFDFDTWLVLYDYDTGEILAENDDFNDFTTDSRLAGALPRGRYVISATSYEVGETGQYTLTVD